MMGTEAPDKVQAATQLTSAPTAAAATESTYNTHHATWTAGSKSSAPPRAANAASLRGRCDMAPTSHGFLRRPLSALTRLPRPRFRISMVMQAPSFRDRAQPPIPIPIPQHNFTRPGTEPPHTCCTRSSQDGFASSHGRAQHGIHTADGSADANVPELQLVSAANQAQQTRAKSLRLARVKTRPDLQCVPLPLCTGMRRSQATTIPLS
jgi:hypothetical protein